MFFSGTSEGKNEGDQVTVVHLEMAINNRSNIIILMRGYYKYCTWIIFTYWFWFISFSALMLLLVGRKGIRPVKIEW